MNRKHEKEYQEYIKDIRKPVIFKGILYPDGYGKPCNYEKWLKYKNIENITIDKFNKVFK